MTDRLKQLRKELGLSQAAFAKKLEISPAAVNEIESGRNRLTNRNFTAICREFNVNPTWLRDGVGEMFLNPSTLDKLAAEYDFTPEESALIKTFAELPATDRQVIIRLVKNFAQSLGVKLPEQVEDRKPDDQLTAEEKRAIMNAELDAEAAGEKLSRSIGISGLKSRNFS